MKKLAVVFVAVVAMVALSGCVTVQDLSTSKDKDIYSCIRVNSTVWSWNVSTRVTVDTVDDQKVESDKTYVAVDPGIHVLTLSFHKDIAPVGLDAVTFTVNGVPVKEAKPSTTIFSIIPRDLRVSAVSGKRYRIYSTDDLHEVGGGPFGSRVEGSWNCEFQEE